jgi:hypothetical protein
MAVASLSATVLASALDAWGNDQLPKAPRGSMYVPQTVVTNTMTATMTTRAPPQSAQPPVQPPVQPPIPPTPSLPTQIESLLPQSPPVPTSQSPSQSPSDSSPQSSQPLLHPAQQPPTSPQILSQQSPTLTTTPIQLNDSEDTQSFLANSSEEPPEPVTDVTMSYSDISEEVSEVHESRESQIHDSLRPRNRQVQKIENNLGTTNTLTASMQISTRTTSPPSSPRAVSATYGTSTFSASISTNNSTPRQINEEGGHIQLLLMLIFSSILILPSGIISQSLGDFENILYVAAAVAPAVGWLIDRAGIFFFFFGLFCLAFLVFISQFFSNQKLIGRPCMFLGIGTIAQLALLLTSIFARMLHGYTHVVDDVVQIIMGVTLSVTVCSAYTGLALLVSGGGSGLAFAGLTVVNSAALSLAPLFFAYTHKAIDVRERGKEEREWG